VILKNAISVTYVINMQGDSAIGGSGAITPQPTCTEVGNT